jgi:F0F1-type ATP synthase assembly protein I
LLGAKSSNAMLRHLSKPIRAVLRWQIVVTALIALAAGFAWGVHGTVSAVAGGLVSVMAGLAAAFVASRSTKSAGGILAGALRAEAVKIGLAVILLWLVLANYAEAQVGVFIAAFVVTMLVFGMAFFVREH